MRCAERVIFRLKCKVNVRSRKDIENLIELLEINAIDNAAKASTERVMTLRFATLIIIIVCRKCKYFLTRTHIHKQQSAIDFAPAGHVQINQN